MLIVAGKEAEAGTCQSDTKAKAISARARWRISLRLASASRFPHDFEFQWHTL